jgi:hypothetical protein
VTKYAHSTSLQLSVKEPLPCDDSPRVIYVNSPFTMTGHLTLRASATGQPVLFSMEVSGRGFAQLIDQRDAFGGPFISGIVIIILYVRAVRIDVDLPIIVCAGEASLGQGLRVGRLLPDGSGWSKRIHTRACYLHRDIQKLGKEIY